MKDTKSINLDTRESNEQYISVVQFDSNSRVLRACITSNGEALDLTGHSVMFSAIKPDGYDIFNECAIVNASAGLVDIVLSQQALAKGGIMDCQCKIVGTGNSILSTQTFQIHINKSTMNVNITSTNEYTALTKALSRIQSIDNKAEKSELDIERKRIDKIVASDNSASNGNSELVDIRIGEDNITYGSAGDAIRQQIKKMKERDYSIVDYAFTPDYILSRGYLNNKGNVSTENGNFNYSSKIKLMAGQIIRIGTNSIPNNVTILGEYKDDLNTTPLITADSRDFKYYYYQAVRDIDVCFCISNKNPYSVDIISSIPNQLFNGLFDRDDIIEGFVRTNDYDFKIADNFETIQGDWKSGYYNKNGNLSKEVGKYINLQLEPNTKYVILIGGFTVDTTIVGLGNTGSTTGSVLRKIKGAKTHIVDFKTTSTGVVGICTNEKIINTNKIRLIKNFGMLKDVVNSLIDKEDIPNIFEVEYVNGETIPAITKTGNILADPPTFQRGYWSSSNGTFKTETSVSCSIQLEPNTQYFAYLGGYSNGTTAIVGLDTLAVTDGTVLAKIPNGANMIEFRSGETGIVGLCTNEAYVAKADALIFKKEAGLITQMLFSFIDERIESYQDIECYVGSSTYSNETHYYRDPVSCFKAIQNHKGHKIVHIYSGVYDIYELMGGYEYFSNINPQSQKWGEVQPVLDNIEIICHGHVEFNMSLPSTLSSDIRWLISPLNVRGNFVINNLVINAENTRYCIHDESGSNYPGTTHEYNNVYCRINSNQAVGCGYSRNSTVKISKCYFESKNSSGYSYHSKGGCNILIEDSILKSGTGVPLRLSEENSKIVDKAVISNTNLITNNSQKLEIRGEWAYSDNPVGYTDIRLINTNINNTNQIRNGYTSVTRNVVAYDTKEGTENILIKAIE